MSDRPGRTLTPILLIVIGVLFIAGAILTLYWTRGATPAPTSAPIAEIPFPEVERVSPEAAKAAFDAGTAVFIDVRSREEYAANHIPGALSMPIGELADRLEELDSGSWIIPY
jgi:hypothetical protein